MYNTLPPHTMKHSLQETLCLEQMFCISGQGASDVRKGDFSMMQSGSTSLPVVFQTKASLDMSMPFSHTMRCRAATRTWSRRCGWAWGGGEGASWEPCGCTEIRRGSWMWVTQDSKRMILRTSHV